MSMKSSYIDLVLKKPIIIFNTQESGLVLVAPISEVL